MTEANRYPGDDGVVPPGSGAEQGSGDDSDRDEGDLDKGKASGDEKPDKEESAFLGNVDDEGEFVSAGAEEEKKEDEGAVPPGFQREQGFGPPIGEKEAGVSAEEPAGSPAAAGEVPSAEVEVKPAEGAAVQGELFTTEPAVSVEAEGVPSLAEAEKWAVEHPAAAAAPEPEAVVEEPEPVAPKPAVKKAPKKKAKKAKKKAAKKAKKKPKKKAKKKKPAKKKKKGKKR
jgi:hypothetical protein